MDSPSPLLAALPLLPGTESLSRSFPDLRRALRACCPQPCPRGLGTGSGGVRAVPGAGSASPFPGAMLQERRDGFPSNAGRRRRRRKHLGNRFFPENIFSPLLLGSLSANLQTHTVLPQRRKVWAGICSSLCFSFEDEMKSRSWCDKN